MYDDDLAVLDRNEVADLEAVEQFLKETPCTASWLQFYLEDIARLKENGFFG